MNVRRESGACSVDGTLSIIKEENMAKTSKRETKRVSGKRTAANGKAAKDFLLGLFTGASLSLGWERYTHAAIPRMKDSSLTRAVFLLFPLCATPVQS